MRVGDTSPTARHRPRARDFISLSPVSPPRTPSPLVYVFAGSGKEQDGPSDEDRAVGSGRVDLRARGRAANRQPGPTREGTGGTSVIAAPPHRWTMMT
jgi:hypothetical protein